MGLISPTYISDGTQVDAVDVNSMVQTIANEFNGGIDSDNIENNAIINSKVADSAITPAKLLSGTGSSWVWQTYVPQVTASTTAPTLGTGAKQIGRYVQIGKTVICKIDIQFGTAGTSAGSGNYFISLPVTADLTDLVYGSLTSGFARMVDNSSGFSAFILPELETSTTIQPVYYTSFTGAGASAITATTPWAWAASDILFRGTIIYEAA